jgi:hypothetical protein
VHFRVTAVFKVDQYLRTELWARSRTPPGLRLCQREEGGFSGLCQREEGGFSELVGGELRLWGAHFGFAGAAPPGLRATGPTGTQHVRLAGAWASATTPGHAACTLALRGHAAAWVSL